MKGRSRLPVISQGEIQISCVVTSEEGVMISHQLLPSMPSLSLVSSNDNEGTPCLPLCAVITWGPSTEHWGWGYKSSSPEATSNHRQMYWKDLKFWVGQGYMALRHGLKDTWPETGKVALQVIYILLRWRGISISALICFDPILVYWLFHPETQLTLESTVMVHEL